MLRWFHEGLVERFKTNDGPLDHYFRDKKRKNINFARKHTFHESLSSLPSLFSVFSVSNATR